MRHVVTIRGVVHATLMADRAEHAEQNRILAEERLLTMTKRQDDEAEMQMAMVRLCRVKNNANDVWSEMERLLPEYSLLEIRAAVRPVILRMMQSL